MKKIIISLFILTFVVYFVLTDSWTKNQLDEVLPEINSYYLFNDEELRALKETLSCFNLDTLSRGTFFSFRYAYYWDDGCDYRTVSDFVCETEDFSNCYKLFYKFKDEKFFVERKSFPKEEARLFYKEIFDLNPFKLKSVKKEPFFVYLGFMHIDGFFSMTLFEIADRYKTNRFSVGTVKSSNKSYEKLMSILMDSFSDTN